MALDSYSGLKDEIQAWLSDTDVADYVDTFIDIAESRFAREIRIRELLSRADLAIADGDRYVNLPSDFQDIKYLRIQVADNPTNGRRYYPNLDQKSIHELTEISVNAERRPTSYSVHAQIEFDAEADQAYTGEIFYYTAMDALTDANTSNELLAKAPDLYLWASLTAAAPFLHHDERIEVWQTMYADGLNTLNTSEIQNRHAGPLVSKVSGGMPRTTR